MHKRSKFIILSFLSFSFLLITNAVAAPSYAPVGPQTNVPVTTVTNGGWTECYRDTYDTVNLDSTAILSNSCTGDHLMLACRQTGSTTIQLLAQAPRADVTTDTGDNLTSTHSANGTAWYYNDPGNNTTGNGNAWGFAADGDAVNKFHCDTNTSGSNNQRLCWHLNNIGGYRCGTDRGINNSTAFERIIYQANASAATSESIPALSFWGLGLMGFLLMLFGRRKIR